MSEFNVVIYHSNCPDGFTSAWVFWLKARQQNAHGLKFIPVNHGQNPPDVRGKKVVIVDFSYSEKQIRDMAKTAIKLVILDHHISAERELKNVDLKKEGKGDIIFDMNRSGAQLAWDYVYPGIERPWFVEYVADRDLWRFNLPNSKEISQTLFFDRYFADFSKLQSLYESRTPQRDMDQLAKRGAVFLELKDADTNSYARHSCRAIFTVPPADGEDKPKSYIVYIAGCPRSYRSDVGNTIMDRYKNECDFAAVYWYDFRSNEWWISLRSHKDSDIDLSIIASRFYNGGGLKRACGFTIRGKENIWDYFVKQDKPN